MKKTDLTVMDGNEAVAYIAHKINEVIAIYPITPASPMGEISDQYSSNEQKNIWGIVPDVISMQSEAGAAGVVHGALQAGTLTTTFTASQGLLLMIPNMYKIAGELSPMVIHVAARSLAAQALSIFGDHSDVMSVRGTGYAIVSSSSVQEAMDMALISQAASLKGKIPFLHFFDGFRTSHEVDKIEMVAIETIEKMMDQELIDDFKQRALTPDKPIIRGTSQNPDVYFQARETVNKYYQALPAITQEAMDKFAQLSGRQYKLFEYHGHPQAEYIVILMGSATQTCEETVNDMLDNNEKVGMINARMFRPLAPEYLLAALPQSTQRIAVLDRCKEPGSNGEPLYKDVQGVIMESQLSVQVIGGRYGLSSKEFTPGMVHAVFDNLKADKPKNRFTIGIHDDVTHTSLAFEHVQNSITKEYNQCLFFGLGSDGTVSANKNSIKIIGEQTSLYAQGYFVYDSKKSGATTVSHLRFSKKPIQSTYLIADDEADFIGCHQPTFLNTIPMLDKAADNAVFLINSHLSGDDLWHSLPTSKQEHIIEKNINVYAIDAYKVAREQGMGNRINTIMQTCFFAISKVLPQDEAIDKIKQAVSKTYGKKGQRIVERNFAAIDASVENLTALDIPAVSSGTVGYRHALSGDAPPFVQDVIAKIISGLGNDIPVSKLPDDGSYPVGTTAYEKRGIALEIPVWDEDLCICCGKCPFVCPHSAIRSKVFLPEDIAAAPDSFLHIPMKGKGYDNLHVSYQVAAEDCTGCGLCVEVCPAVDKSDSSHKSLDMKPLVPELLEREKANWDFFLSIKEYDRAALNFKQMKSAMIAQPLFEFSSACVGCGETPYIRLATQLFGDRMLIANATGCSSIYGGNLPTTPYTTNKDGRGPTWSNSLFEDNAEFGLGFRLAINQQQQLAARLLKEMSAQIADDGLVEAVINANHSQTSEVEIFAQRARIDQLRQKLSTINSDQSRQLLTILDYLSKKSVWIIGGDGWAYDIGYSGLDHIFSTGHDVNILVLDTEVYSNTGGQTSKATPRGAVAKFSASGKKTSKKDLGLIAMAYENVYVAVIASGAKDMHTIKAMQEAESYPGTSLIIAYSPCIAHGVDLRHNLRQQKMAVASGHWPLYRYDPRLAADGKNPLMLDSKPPQIPLEEYYNTETRFKVLWRSHPELAKQYVQEEQKAVNKNYEHLKQLSTMSMEKKEIL